MCNKLIQTLKKVNVFLDISTSVLSSLVGKSGRNIKKMKNIML